MNISLLGNKKAPEPSAIQTFDRQMAVFLQRHKALPHLEKDIKLIEAAEAERRRLKEAVFKWYRVLCV